MPKIITRAELEARLRANFALVMLEALPEKFYRDWHLPGALHMPHDQVRSLAPQLVPDKTIEIVVYCASDTCQNSHIAARALTALRHSNVSVYAGGKQDWFEAGLPVERPADVVAIC